MKSKTLILTVGACVALLLAAAPGWAQDGFYFWRLGHMDGPHISSKALGISDDGEVAVGATLVVDFQRAWRCDIDWTIATDDGVPPLYNELFVQEDIGIIAPAVPSAAYASSDLMTDTTGYDLPNLQLDWGGSRPVGTIMQGTVSYGIQWLLPVADSVDEGDFVLLPDFGGGASLMEAKDVSTDGLIVVGYGNNKRGPLAFYADMTDPLLPIVRSLSIVDYTSGQSLQWTKAEAVSADGLVVAGYGGTKTGNRAFVTVVVDATTDPITLDLTQTFLLPMLDGGHYAEAYAMTPDGAIIAGRSDSNRGPQACIWFKDATTGEWAVKGLGALSKKKYDSVATGIAYRPGSPVGELIVVGNSKTNWAAEEAFVWTGNPVLEDDLIGYMYTIEYVLIHTGAGEISLMGSEWILNQATGVAFGEDGTRMVGWGVNPEGGTEAWLVTGYPFDELVFTH